MAEAQLTQREVDEVRRRAMMQILVTHVTRLKNPNPPVQHLRFSKPHTRAYSLHMGNPPPDVVRKDARPGEKLSDQWRFPWEKGLRLECDLGYIKPETAVHVWRLLHDMQASGGDEPVWDCEQISEHLAKILNDNEIPIDVPRVSGRILSPAEIARQEDEERRDVIDFIQRRAVMESKRTKH